MILPASVPKIDKETNEEEYKKLQQGCCVQAPKEKPCGHDSESRCPNRRKRIATTLTRKFLGSCWTDGAMQGEGGCSPHKPNDPHEYPWDGINPREDAA